MNIIRIALIAPQEKDRQQLREQMFSYAVRWKVAVVTDCFDCLEEFAMAAQSGGYQLVCLRGGERQWRAAEELRRIRGEGETLWAYLEEGQALRAKVLTAAEHLRRRGVAAGERHEHRHDGLFRAGSPPRAGCHSAH